MKTLSSEYCIDVPKIKLGKHQQSFHLDASLFEGQPDISDANIDAHLTIERTTRHIDIQYHLTGSMQLSCDRCLLPYPQPVDSLHQVVYSFEKSMEEQEDTEVMYIPRSIHLLDVAQDLYDFVCLSVPLKRVPDDCPKASCPPEVLKYIKDENQTEEEETSADEIDPRWEALKALTRKEQ